MRQKVLSHEDLWDLCFGAAVLGTGGGGSPKVGCDYLNSVVNTGKRVVLANLEDIPDDAIIACPAGVASIAPTERAKQIDRILDQLIATEKNPYFEGLRILEEYIGRKFYGCLPIEMGGFNTACAAWTAALADIILVDADPVGRAIPEIELQTFNIFNIPITPMVLSDFFGNVAIVTRVENDKAAEEIARAMAVIGGAVSFVGRPIEGRELKKSVIPGTVSKAMTIGKALREAKAKGLDPVQEVIKAAGGIMLFEGIVKKVEWNDSGGFMWGYHFIEGRGKYLGHELKIWFKNENLISWYDEKPFVACPDLLCIIDSSDGYPITNTTMSEGRNVVVFGVPAYEIWKTEKGLKLLSPAHFGYEGEFKLLNTTAKSDI
ncbi:DUF917 domain-containing protein [Thermoanaerobacteraceae bacterium SP2]|nr:DUF917 domain-containing protein [Thermoanaerobacteraceae bacterium SP2]